MHQINASCILIQLKSSSHSVMIREVDWLRSYIMQWNYVISVKMVQNVAESMRRPIYKLLVS